MEYLGWVREFGSALGLTSLAELFDGRRPLLDQSAIPNFATGWFVITFGIWILRGDLKLLFCIGISIESPSLLGNL